MRLRHLSTLLIAALTLACGCHHDISGDYLASDPSTVARLQLVRTPDEHLTGQLFLSKIATDGRVEFDSVGVSGVIGDGNVTLSGSRFFGLQSFTLSGTLDGDKLTLSGSGGSMPFVLKRSSLDDYQKQVAKLDAQSQTILAAKAAALSRQKAEQEQRNEVAQQAQHTFAVEQSQRNFVAQIDQLIVKLQRFDSAADVHLVGFPAVEKQYHAFTEKMTGDVERERQLAGNDNVSNARYQLSNAATQISNAADQLHNQGESLESDMDTNVKPLADDGTMAENLCRQSGPGDLTPIEIEAHSAACDRLNKALPTFRQKYEAVKSGLAHLEQVYARESKTQQGLLRTAEKLQ